MLKILQKMLASLARKIVAKYKPTIVGITGSVGKTSSKEAIFLLVSQKYKTYHPSGNLNNELGLPLAIIGLNTPGKNVFGWIQVFLRALGLILFTQKYPEVLVLEYGIDRVGDMDYLLSIAKPHISVLTNIGMSHYEYFKDPAILDREKGRIIEVLQSTDFAVLNGDSERVKKQSNRTKARVVTYGLNNSDVCAKNVEMHLVTPFSTSFTVQLVNREINVSVNVIGYPYISSLLSAIAVADILKIETSLIEKGLLQYKPVPGRLNILSGIKKSWIIDDTYNAAPDSMNEAMDVYEKLNGQHKMLVLGDMLELGQLSEEEHIKIGKRVAQLLPSHLVTVGPSGRIIAESALSSGLPEQRIISFNTSDEAAVPVQELMREGSVVLVKGSQGVRMEKIVKEIMAEPMRSAELLCRQYGKWLIQ